MVIKEIADKIMEIKTELDKRYETLEKELKAKGEISPETKATIEKLEKRLVDLEVKSQRPGGQMPPVERKSIGRQFIESEEYKTMRAKGRLSCDPVEVKDLVSSASDSAGALLVPQRIGGIFAQPDMPLTVRDLLGVGQAESNSIEYVRELVYTNASATVKESTEAKENAKPESALSFELKTASVQTIAHWIPASRQIIQDAAQLQSYINARLTYGLKLTEELQLLFGSGIPPDLNGICIQATPYDDTIVTDLGVTNTTRIDHIRAAILQARQARYAVTGIVLNPFDFAAIELAKNTIGNYLWVTVTEGGQARLWRVPVIESDNMPQDNFLVGAFKMGAQIWDREQTTIRIAEQHADFFVKNMVAILCEERIALTVYRPEAFIYGEFTPGS